MQCTECGTYQEEGKFCGNCGGKLQEATETPEVSSPESEEAKQPAETSEVEGNEGTVAASEQANESVEKLKEVSSAYGSFFTHYLKRPADSFNNSENQFINGLINLSIIGVFLAITMHRLISNLVNEVGYGFVEGPSFFSTFLSILITYAIVTAIIITILFAVNKIFGTLASFKEIVAIFGVHMTLVVAISALALILSIVKANTFAFILIMITVMLVFSVIPLYIISHLLSKEPKNLDPLYGYLIYIVGVSITFAIVMSIFLDSTIGNFINDTLDYM